MEYVAHLFVKLRSVDEEVALEIVFEAAEIEVCRTDTAKIIVYEHHLAVEHPCVIEVDFDAGGETLRYIAVGSRCEHRGVAVSRHHYADIHT